MLPFAIIFLFQTMRMIPETSADKREWSVNIVLGSMSAASIKSTPTGFEQFRQDLIMTPKGPLQRLIWW